MTRLISKTNLYFFGEEEICTHDKYWFYGLHSFLGLTGLFLLIMNLITKL